MSFRQSAKKSTASQLGAKLNNFRSFNAPFFDSCPYCAAIRSPFCRENLSRSAGAIRSSMPAPAE
jgi:hypothetical protein